MPARTFGRCPPFGLLLCIEGLLLASLAVGVSIPAARAADVERTQLLPPGPDNPRNSEGSFVELRDGRILFVYSHFTGKSGSDHASAYLAGRFSSDGGQTWSKQDTVVLPKEGDMNVMSVSLLRLRDGRIALFYLRKNSLVDCRPCVRFSSDEAQRWSEPVACITDQVGYYVLNNDRAVQLTSGRIVLPVALHNTPQYEKPDWTGKITCYVSDDAGRTWRRGAEPFSAQDARGKRVTLQEPGVVELKDGRVMMFIRTASGSQFLCYSRDGGQSWTPPEASSILGPCSPASIKRIPRTGDLLLVWNNHAEIDPKLRGKRTPLAVAISHDEGRTWEKIKNLETDPDGWYCYTAIAPVGDHVLLAHCWGSKTVPHLALTQITRFRLDWLYR